MIKGRRVSVRRGVVSFFDSYLSTKPICEVDLNDWILSTHTSTYKAEIDQIRQCADKLAQRALKSKLPCITVSGVFSKRCVSGLVSYSGFICIDVDGKDNPSIVDLNALKNDLFTRFDTLYYAGLSAGGNGLFLMFAIQYPEKHAEHFAAICEDLAAIGIVVDKVCSDVSRLRGVSYDPYPILNFNAKIYTKRILADKSVIEKTPYHYKAPALPSDITARRVAQLVETIKHTGANIAEDYPDWYAIGRALASEFGQSGRDYFHTISRQSSKYNAAQCDRQFNACLKNCSNTSISTLFWYCKNAGITIER